MSLFNLKFYWNKKNPDDSITTGFEIGAFWWLLLFIFILGYFNVSV